MKKLPIQIRIIVIVVIALIAFEWIAHIFNSNVSLFNTTKTLQAEYVRKVQQQVSNYDGYYLAFIDKQENAGISKETFVEVTNIIMQSRKDGQGVAWKWVHENQNIPYEKFTSFYHELSAFISERYADNMQIEREKQDIVRQHNLLLMTFPNSFYNHFMHIQPLVYTPGYISDFTRSRFK